MELVLEETRDVLRTNSKQGTSVLLDTTKSTENTVDRSDTNLFPAQKKESTMTSIPNNVLHVFP